MTNLRVPEAGEIWRWDDDAYVIICSEFNATSCSCKCLHIQNGRVETWYFGIGDMPFWEHIS